MSHRCEHGEITGDCEKCDSPLGRPVPVTPTTKPPGIFVDIVQAPPTVAPDQWACGPVEMHARRQYPTVGYVIGKRSELLKWGNGSKFVAFSYDREDAHMIVELLNAATSLKGDDS